MGSEFAPNGDKSDRLFSSSSIYFVGLVLAPRFFSQWLAQNISQQSASFVVSRVGSNCDRRGGISMQLKMWILSGTAIALWLTPLTALDKKVGWHKSIQGLSLGAAVACAVSAGNIARKLVEENEIETIKNRAITADVVDEIATTAYISQAQRQQEAEQILSEPPDREETVEALKRAWLLDCAEPAEPAPKPEEPTVQVVQVLNQPEDNALAVDEERFTSLNLDRNQALTLIKKLRVELNQTQMIEKLWECKKGGSEAWKRAYAQFKTLVKEDEKT
jgi:hypothetical protein